MSLKEMQLWKMDLANVAVKTRQLYALKGEPRSMCDKSGISSQAKGPVRPS